MIGLNEEEKDCNRGLDDIIDKYFDMNSDLKPDWAILMRVESDSVLWESTLDLTYQRGKVKSGPSLTQGI